MGGTSGQGVFERVADHTLNLHTHGQISYRAAVEILALLVQSLREETDWDTVDDIRTDLLENPLIHSALVVSGWFEEGDHGK